MPAGNPSGYLTPAEVEQLNRLGGLGARERQLAEALKAHRAFRPPDVQYETGIGRGLGGLASGIAAALRGQKEQAMAGQLAGVQQEREGGVRAALGAQSRMPQADTSALLSGDQAASQAAQQSAAQAIAARRELARQYMASGDPQLMEFGKGLLGEADDIQGRLDAAAGKRFDLTGKRQLATDESAAATELQKLRDKAAMQRLDRELTARDTLEGKKLEADKTRQALQATEGLRKEFNGNPVVRSFNEVSTALGKVEKTGTGTPSAAGDMALVFAYMKMLDPGSTVREGEYANAQNATGVPGQIINLYNKAKDGQLLNQSQRADFLARARQMFEPHKQEFGKLATQYQTLATKQGLDPADVVGFGLTPAEMDRMKQLEALEAQGAPK